MMTRPSIIEACRALGIPVPRSAADLHAAYAAFALAGVIPNTEDTPHWRGVCDCLERYAGQGRTAECEKIMEHLELLDHLRERD